MFRLAKFFIEHMVKDTLSSAGNHIGEAIGKRISKHINPPPPKDDEKDPEGKDEEDENPTPTDGGETVH